MATLAMVVCVRDEELMLAAHLTHHHLLGVSRAYVFLDRCTDRSAEIVSTFPWAVAIARNRDPLHGETRFNSRYQMQCVRDALSMARRDGFEWLLHVDADELSWGGGETGSSLVERGSLIAMLDRARPETDQVILRTKEVVPEVTEANAPFWVLRNFQTDGVLVRPVLDPVAGRVVDLEKWIGHAQGKSVVRTRAPIRPRSVHLWAYEDGGPDRGDPPTEELGWHYHFVVVSGAHWRAKYRKLAADPPEWASGAPVPFPKQSWKEASLRFSEEESEAYFRTWIAVRPELIREYRDRGIVSYEPFVHDLLENQEPTRRSPSL